MLNFDKEKYLQIAITQGPHVALTELHREQNLWEIDMFEGPKGYQPERVSELEEVRKFSRELWEIALRSDGESPQ